MKIYNPTTLAYFAGLADGEGCFGIRKATWHMRHGLARTPAYHEDIRIKMKDVIALRLLKTGFDGMLRRERKTAYWVWEVRDRRAANFAGRIMPFLKIKKRQARLLLKLRKSKDSWRKQGGYRGHHGGSMPVPTSVLKYREKLFREVKRLNSGRRQRKQAD